MDSRVFLPARTHLRMSGAQPGNPCESRHHRPRRYPPAGTSGSAIASILVLLLALSPFLLALGVKRLDATVFVITPMPALALPAPGLRLGAGLNIPDIQNQEGRNGGGEGTEAATRKCGGEGAHKQIESVLVHDPSETHDTVPAADAAGHNMRIVPRVWKRSTEGMRRG